MLRIYFTSQSRYPANSRDLKKRITRILNENGVTEAELTINLVGERKMRDLAEKYLHETEENETHEVLSFPASDVNASFIKGVNIKGFAPPDDILNLGDIVICYPQVRKIAIRYKRMMDDVLGELAEHGTLHLLGLHHE